jgi:hypothetical protein
MSASLSSLLTHLLYEQDVALLVRTISADLPQFGVAGLENITLTITPQSIKKLQLAYVVLALGNTRQSFAL